MNKKRILILALIIIIILTGCVKYDLKMGVGSDKSFTITLIDAIQKEYAENLDPTSNTETYEKLGFTVEEYDDSTHVGLKITKKYDSIDEISSSDCEGFELTNLIQEEETPLILFKSNKIGTVTTYIANFTYDLSTDESTSTNEEIDYTEYTDTMIFKYTVSLPDTALIISENADEKTNNDHTLTWNMKYGELKEIKFSFNIDDKDVTDPIIDDNQSEDDNIKGEDYKEEKTTDKKETFEISSDKNIFGTLIGSLLVVALVLGTIVAKIRKKKENVTPTIAMTHKEPPRNRKE